MKNKRMFYLKSGLFITLSLMITSLSFGQSPANFSGSWVFNESKSNLGEGGMRRISQKLTITQSETSLTIDRYYTPQNGEERKMSETYTLNGKVSVNTVFNNSKKSTATWATDKKSLTVSSEMVFEMNGQKNEIKTVEVYKNTDNGKTLSIDSQSTSSMGDRKTTLIYDKK